mgnify:CR=1 FL=1
MRCHSVEDISSPESPCVTIKMQPVVGDGGEENASFSKWTPSGNLELTVTNPDAVPAFVAGNDYYVDITRLGVPVPAAPQPARVDAGELPPAEEAVCAHAEPLPCEGAQNDSSAPPTDNGAVAD